MTRDIAIKTAAKWWTDKLRIGNPDMEGVDTPNDDQLAVFTAELENMIPKFMDVYDILHRDDPGTVVHLGCEFAPHAVLASAAIKAGINPFNFPFKTYTYVKKKGPDDYRFLVASGEPFHDSVGRLCRLYEEVEPCE